MKPRILLSGKLNIDYYIDAVKAAGGIPTAEYLPEISTDYDGLILCGGSDIDPAYYGEAMDGSVDLDPDRDKVEFALAKAFVEAGKPILGICRGSQLLNVFFGGSLIQDLRNAEAHKAHEGVDAAHEVTALADSIAAELYGERFWINSAHHQAVKKLGDGLRITMMAEDVIEGFEHEELPVFAVQWHPERMCLSKARSDTVDGLAIFKHFVHMCK